MRFAVVGFGNHNIGRIDRYFSEKPEEVILCGSGNVRQAVKKYVEEMGVLLTEILSDGRELESASFFALVKQIADYADKVLVFYDKEEPVVGESLFLLGGLSNVALFEIR